MFHYSSYSGKFKFEFVCLSYPNLNSFQNVYNYYYIIRKA